jgi:hypothetical protein
MKIFRKEIKKIEAEEAEAATSEDEKKDTPEQSTSKGKGKEKKDEGKEVVVTAEDATIFWISFDTMSGSQLISKQVVLDFSYVGFSPNAILISIITKGYKAKRTQDEIKTDIADMCTIAVVKGSITETNLKKMPDAGKRFYSVLEARYGLMKGGSKGIDASVITVARVGAAFPGAMMKILMEQSDLAKKFSGPFGSKILPYYLRHQCAAASIPESFEENSKQFLLGLITAFTSDQSKMISKDKKRTPIEIYEDQENFVSQTHSANYPAEPVRKEIFKKWSIIADYDKLNTVATNVSKVYKDFILVSKEDLQLAFNAV